MAVRTLIADDEAWARRRLVSMLSEVPEIVVIAETKNGLETAKMIDRLRPDLVLLDIQMPLGNGFEVLERVGHTPEVVFVTAYDEYAIRAFEINAADYLLKPYSKERLLKAIERAVRFLRETTDQRARILSILERYRESDAHLSRITVRSGSEYRVFDVTDIAFFRAEESLVFLHFAGGRYLVDVSLQHLEDKLNPNSFLRVHRNAIVNLKKIARILPSHNGKLVVEVAGGERVTVSRDRAAKLRSAAGFLRSSR